MANLTNNVTLSFPTSLITTTPGGISVQTSVSHKAFVNSRSGGSNVRWKEKIRRGENATTNFSGTLQSLTEWTPGRYILNEVWTSDGSLVQHLYATGETSPPEMGGTQASAPTADNQALKHLLKAIRDQRTSFQGGVFLGEMREALKMLASPAKSLRLGLNDFLTVASKRARNGKLQTKNRILAETWLEYSFGWKPFLSDIMEASQAYVKHKEKILTNRLTRLGEESSHTKHQTNAPGGNMWGVPIRTSKESTTHTTVVYRVGLRVAGQGASPNISVMERAGLTLSQFIPTVWELIPYSFLVDYFTNIGDMINAGATYTGDVIWVNRTIRSINKTRCIYVPDESLSYAGPPFRRTISGSPGTFETYHKTVSRSIPLLSYPSFQVGIPGKPVQWINMAALAVSAGKVSRGLMQHPRS